MRSKVALFIGSMGGMIPFVLNSEDFQEAERTAALLKEYGFDCIEDLEKFKRLEMAENALNQKLEQSLFEEIAALELCRYEELLPISGYEVPPRTKVTALYRRKNSVHFAYRKARDRI